MDAEELLSRLLYRDALMLVINKPAGLPVHAGTGGGETLDRHFHALQFGLPRPPALAHRLDRDTSGCLILGRNRHALHKLGNMFAIGRIKKTYWAVVHGHMPQPEGRIDMPLEKQSESSKRWWMKIAESGGQSAITNYRVLGQSQTHSWLEFKPETGRTHQLRVHSAALGHAIMGDKIYGTQEPGERLQLHATALEVPLYDKKPPIVIEAPPPEHMLELLAQCGYLKS